MQAAQQIDGRGHGRAGVPDALQPVAARADDDRRFLPAARAPVERGQVVGQDLQAVEQVVEVLDFGDGAQAAQGQPDGLADDGGLANAGVGDAQAAVLLLQPGPGLIDAAEVADILAESDHARIAGQHGIEGGVEDLRAGNETGVVRVDGFDFRHVQRRLGRAAVEVGAIALAVGRQLRLPPGQQPANGRLRAARFAPRGRQRLIHGD